MNTYTFGNGFVGTASGAKMLVNTPVPSADNVDAVVELDANLVASISIKAHANGRQTNAASLWLKTQAAQAIAFARRTGTAYDMVWEKWFDELTEKKNAHQSVKNGRRQRGAGRQRG